ncbi:hypothetical protein [Sphingobium sp. CR28]|uniref:hypothetical protein n=1 Tax=Sphingobium sp. CR28 TaxID=3400272 RepID=UPI003FF13716
MSFVNKAAFGVAAALAMGVSVQASAQQTDCRAITDPAARLACYDTRDQTPPGSPSSAAPAPSRPSTSAPVAPAPMATAPSGGTTTTKEAVKADPFGEVAVVTRLRYGRFRIQLADGRVFDTTVNNVTPPVVGETVTFRRGGFGNTFLDMKNGDSITVRLSRPSR